MQWLITLETERDLIVTCRLINMFRRKGLKIVTLAMAARPNGFSMMAVLDSPEAQVDHIFNFLRRMEGVQHVTYYRHETSEDASFIFIDADPDTWGVADILKAFPRSKLIFASQGKYLLEVHAEGRRQTAVPAFGIPEVLPFARARTTRNEPRPELIVA
jgi:acetolactate synthase regulatory subunit